MELTRTANLAHATRLVSICTITGTFGFRSA